MSEGRSPRRLPWFVRWLHTYVSMIGFLVIVFFGITGLTLNHADWFESAVPVEQSAAGTLDATWLAFGAEDDRDVDRLAIVEHLRKAHAIAAAVSDFRLDEDECVVVFKAPGYSADAFIARATGTYELNETCSGLMAVLDDLHKGRDAGTVWSWVVDISAIITAISGLTGLWLLWFVKKRRISGLIFAGIGAAIPLILYFAFVG